MTNDSGDLTYHKLLQGNRAWVERKLQQDPEYFKRMAAGQTPHSLWIGCSDSRMPASDITDTAPGEVFVQRNVANLVLHTDLNVMSVLEYAVDVLQVKHVIVCGHYGCGGVLAAVRSRSYDGILDSWLRNIKDVYRLHREELSRYSEEEHVMKRLVELNVIEQVYNLGKTSIVQRAWAQRGEPEIHGWCYDIGDGVIRDLGVNFRTAAMLDEIYRYKYEPRP